MKSQFSTKIIKEARRMYKQGFSLAVIKAELGYEGQRATLRRLVNERVRIKHDRLTRIWSKNNATKVAQINKRASKKYNRLHLLICECGRTMGEKSKRCKKCYHKRII